MLQCSHVAFNCCGCSTIKGFNGVITEADLKKAVARCRNNAIAVLNASQKQNYGEVLKKCGFEIIQNGFYNPNENSILYVYMYIKRPDKSPGHEKFNKDVFEVKANNVWGQDGYERLYQKGTYLSASYI